MRNIKLTISYDGSGYHGWQTQANAVTVQETVETALEKMIHEKACLIASGRTDAGVHAAGQVANFSTSKDIPVEGFLKGLNSILPPDIAVLGAEEVDIEFHSRTWAREKEYLYRLILSGCRLPLLNRRAWVLRGPLDVEAMVSAAALLSGRHDFSAFMASGSSVKTTVRTVSGIALEETLNVEYESLGLKEIRIRVRADGFLRYMVRNMVGFLVDTGLGRRQAGEAAGVLEGKDRSLAGPCAPAGGLYLYRVFY